MMVKLAFVVLFKLCYIKQSLHENKPFEVSPAKQGAPLEEAVFIHYFMLNAKYLGFLNKYILQRKDLQAIFCS